jgi:cell division protein FtsL
MANNKKKQMSRREMRSLRTQQVVFLIISVIIVLAMILSLVSN